MGKRYVFWIGVAIATGMWLLGVWGVQVQAEQVSTRPASACAVDAPQQQSCAECQQRPDLQIQGIRLEPDPPGVDQSYNVHVQILNACAASPSNSWAHLYINRAPVGDPDLEAFARTAGLGRGQSIEAHFTITHAYAIAGWHTLSVRIDALNDVPNEACDGESNNEGAATFDIRQIYPTNTPPPTLTPFPAPEIFFFTPEEETVAYGDPVVLQWQVNGQAVSVYLDGELMPMVNTYTVYPTEDHVYTLRAENPGGSVYKTSRITMVEPTETPTLTPTPCEEPIIREFGSVPDSVVRGERVTVYWDVSNAREVFLNGTGVEGVSSKTFRLDRTTEFVLTARNDCGEVSSTLTVLARYATPTWTFTPTSTPTPTRTATPTYTPYVPTSTPTRNVLDTPTSTVVPGSTHTPTSTATNTAFESPVGPGTPTRTPPPTPTDTSTPEATPSGTVTETATLEPTVTATATQPATDTPLPTPTLLPTETPTLIVMPSPSATATLLDSRMTVVPDTAATEAAATLTPAPTPSAALSSTTGSIRAYLCPLSVLLVFAVGVLALSIVMPRLQERRPGYQAFSDAGPAYEAASPVEREGGATSAGAPPTAPDARGEPAPADPAPVEETN